MTLEVYSLGFPGFFLNWFEIGGKWNFENIVLWCSNSGVKQRPKITQILKIHDFSILSKLKS